MRLPSRPLADGRNAIFVPQLEGQTEPRFEKRDCVGVHFDGEGRQYEQRGGRRYKRSTPCIPLTALGNGERERPGIEREVGQ